MIIMFISVEAAPHALKSHPSDKYTHRKDSRTFAKQMAIKLIKEEAQKKRWESFCSYVSHHLNIKFVFAACLRQES